MVLVFVLVVLTFFITIYILTNVLVRIYIVMKNIKTSTILTSFVTK